MPKERIDEAKVRKIANEEMDKRKAKAIEQKVGKTKGDPVVECY